MAKNQGEHGKDWITKESLIVLDTYGSDQITLRQLYYRLVSIGLKNCIQSYKRVVAVMTQARKEGIIPYEAFEDRDRAVLGDTNIEIKDIDSEIENVKSSIKFWINHYRLNKWSNQPQYVEVWIEKKALQGVLAPVCSRAEVGLFACKGYPSLSSLYEASQKFNNAISEGHDPIIIYMGDYDPTGEDIPRSIKESLAHMGAYVEVEVIALNEEQVLELGLPPAPVKASDSRSANWDGLGQVELDAMEPSLLKEMSKKAIESHFDMELYIDLKETEKTEREAYTTALKEYVSSGDLELELED